MLDDLHTRGVRGIRVMDLPGGTTPAAGLDDAGRMAREMGWSLIVQVDGRAIEGHLDRLAAIGTDWVLDHTGKFLEPIPPDDPRVDAICRLLDRGNVWIKICGLYETNRSGPPHYGDVAAIARRLIAAAPERAIWGSNWPHVGVPRSAYPNDARLLDLLGEIAPDAVRRRILVENPARLYGFGTP